MSEPRIGLVLGGGGARGIAHVPVIEALDELGVRPAAIAGTSIGAVYGAGRAGGLTGAELRAVTLDRFGNRAAALARLWTLRPKKFADLLSSGLGLGQIDPEKILATFVGDEIRATFGELTIPLAVVATDYYGGGAASLISGDLRRAVAASIAIPAVFRPVVIEGRVLVDGGVVDPVPVGALPVEVDLIVAVDIASYPEPAGGKALPGALEVMFGASQLMQQQIAAARFERNPPDVLIRPPVNHVRALDFLDAPKILAAAEPAKEEAKRRIGRLIEAHMAESVRALESPKKRRWLPAVRLRERSRGETA
ncbi:MAG: patatin-like phospholipase family protein [Siculibacillus sp.]|nr:patatin-like phospholipase family protein [Siculibacillus sp.]